MPEGGVKPEPRNEHVSVAHDNKYYIFGGMAGTDVQSLKQYQDVWMILWYHRYSLHCLVHFH